MPYFNRARRLLAGAGLGLALVLAGCAATGGTPYQPIVGNRASGGYSEVRLAPNRYRVTFAGNTFTSRDVVEGYLLYRSAELTVQLGYDWFEIVDRDTEHDVRTRIEPDPFYSPWYGSGYVYWSPYWRYYGRGRGWVTWHPYVGDPFWASRVDQRTVERFEASAEIVMHSGALPVGRRRVFDARRVMADLGPRIRRP